MKEIFSKWFIANKIHLLTWGIFILYETLVVGIIFNIYGNPITYLLHYAVIILCFYLNAIVSLPWALSQKGAKWWRIFLTILYYLASYIILHYIVDLFLIYLQVVGIDGVYRLDYQFVLKNLYRGIFFLGFSTGYYFLKTYLQEKSRQQEYAAQHFKDIMNQRDTEKKLADAQNSFLKAQISPHFLFNTLDFIYYNIDRNSVNASEAIIILSKMMRYIVDLDKMGDFVLLEDEIEQVEHLVQLYQLMRNTKLDIHLECHPEIRNIRFVPLVLLTLVENIFKHGDLSKNGPGAFIRMWIKDEFFHIQTKNQPNRIPDTSGSKNGLKNIKNRLFYAYGSGLHFDSCIDQDDNFIIQISSSMATISKSYNACN
ncbi:sensor histidine kinase [Pedobacter sp. AW31-3R]|uniref:sensor histidine kinase n=1 Tax=Pedobacter sp. AW31-3R TaxID=3445781 RepID=UPI003F9F315A